MSIESPFHLLSEMGFIESTFCTQANYSSHSKCNFNRFCGFREEPALAAMHGPHSVSDIGDCTVIHCDAGGVSLVDQ